MKTAYKTIFTLSLLCHVFAAEPKQINAPQNSLKVEKTEQQDNSFSNFITFKKPSTQNEWLAFGKRYLEFELAQEELDQFEASTPLPKPIETKEFKNKAVMERAQKQVRQKDQYYALLPSSEQGKQQYGLFNIKDLLSTFNAYHRRYQLALRSIDEKLCFFPKTMTGEASDISFGFAYQDPTDLNESDKIKIVIQSFEDKEMTLLSLFEDVSDLQNKLSFMRVSASFFNFLRVILFPMLDWNKIRDGVKARTQDIISTSLTMDRLSDRTFEESQSSENATKPVIAEIVHHYVPQMADFLENGNITTLSTARDTPHEIPLLNVYDTVEELRSLRELNEHIEALISLIKEIKEATPKFNYKDFSPHGRASDILVKFRAAFLPVIKPVPLEGQYARDFKRVLLKDTNPDILDQLCAFHFGEEKSPSAEKNLNSLTKRYLDIYAQTYVTPGALVELDNIYLLSKTHNVNWQGRIFEDLACFVHTAAKVQAEVYLKNVPNTSQYSKDFTFGQESNLVIRQIRLDNEIKALEEVLKLSKDLALKNLVENIGQEDSLKYLKLAFTKYNLERVVFGSLHLKFSEITTAIQHFKESFADQIPTLKEEVKQKPASAPSKKKKKKKKAVGQVAQEPLPNEITPPEQQPNSTQHELIQSTVSVPDSQKSTEGSAPTQELQAIVEAESKTSKKLNAEDAIVETSVQTDAGETSQNPVPVPSIELEEQKQLNEKLRNDLAASRLELEQVHSQLEAEKKVSTSTSKQYLEVTQELSKLEAEKVELQKNLSDLEAELKSVKQKALQREAEMSTKMAEQARSIVSLSRLVNDLKKENEIVRSQKARIAELEEIAKERLSKNKEKQKELKRAADELEEAEGKIRKLELFFKAAQDDLVKKEIDLNVYRTKLDALEQSNKTLILQNTSLNLIIQDPDMVLSKFHQFLGEKKFKNFLMYLEQSSRTADR